MFFEQHVKPTYEDWKAHPFEEWRAKSAVGELNNMAERVFHHWRGVDRMKLHGAVTAHHYREEIASRECSDFALIRDVADAHKHLELDRTSRRITRSDQTGVGRVGWGEALGESLGGDDEIVIVLDDGSKRSLRGVAKNVYMMWERLLASWGL
jgi:hypothetical protein